MIIIKQIIRENKRTLHFIFVSMLLCCILILCEAWFQTYGLKVIGNPSNIFGYVHDVRCRNTKWVILIGVHIFFAWICIKKIKINPFVYSFTLFFLIAILVLIMLGILDHFHILVPLETRHVFKWYGNILYEDMVITSGAIILEIMWFIFHLVCKVVKK